MYEFKAQNRFEFLKEKGIATASHYVPLHSSEAEQLDGYNDLLYRGHALKLTYTVVYFYPSFKTADELVAEAREMMTRL